jgi:hypothetical protein
MLDKKNSKTTTRYAVHMFERTRQEENKKRKFLLNNIEFGET